MPIFICPKCGVEENTALGHYWGKSRGATYWFGPGVVEDKYEYSPLCSECAPALFHEGSPSGYGKWHGRFEKVYPQQFTSASYQSPIESERSAAV